MRFVLASASPARLQVLQRAGVAVSVQVSGVDESGVTASTTDQLVVELARLKAESVFATVATGDVIVVGCDSLLDLDGRACGKPGTPPAAVEQWRSMRGRTGRLLTGHHVIVRRAGQIERRSAPASTTVSFANLSDAEIDAYVATGEPLGVAGAFTIDGLAGPFVTALKGDPHNVLGLSLPLLRDLLADAGVPWISLWAPSP